MQVCLSVALSECCGYTDTPKLWIQRCHHQVIGRLTSAAALRAASRAGCCFVFRAQQTVISVKLLPACVGLASRGTLAILSQVKLTNRTEKATTLIVHLPAYSTAGIVPFGACSQVRTYGTPQSAHTTRHSTRLSYLLQDRATARHSCDRHYALSADSAGFDHSLIIPPPAVAAARRAQRRPHARWVGPVRCCTARMWD